MFPKFLNKIDFKRPQKQIYTGLIIDSTVSSWNENVQQIRDSIIALKERLMKEEPKDRLDAIGKIVECIDFMKQSNIGWMSVLANPSIASKLEEEALKDIYARFRKMAIERIDNDVDCINRYMIDLLS